MSAEQNTKVMSITFEQLMRRMREMEIGDVIGLATWMDENTREGEGWFAVMRIDLSRVDQDSAVWVIEWFGGSGNPSIVTDYDNCEYLEDDLRKALKDKELLQPDGTVLIDENDWKEPENMQKYDEPKTDWNDAFEKLREIADKADQLAGDIEETKEYHDKWAEDHDLAIVTVRELTTIMQKAAQMADEIALTMERKELEKKRVG